MFRLFPFRVSFGVLLLLAALPSVSAQAAGPSANVAYVFDGSTSAGTGLGSVGGGNGYGTDIFANRGSPPCASPCTYTGITPNVTLTNVPLSTLDVSPAAAAAVLAPYDTVLLYQTCHIGDAAHTLGMSAINAFLLAGGKVVIFDADGCYTPSSGPNQAADWSGFLFPFATTSPGPVGLGGSYTFVETNTLTAGILALEGCGTAPCAMPGDSVGDANVFDITKNIDPAWCTSIQGSNALGTNENIQAYARTSSGGLAIYDGEDYWFPIPTPEAQAHLKLVFDNILAQEWNPDGLPCTTPVAVGGSITICKQTEPAAGTGFNFGWSAPLIKTMPFPLNDDDCREFLDLAASSGPYSFTELQPLPPYWQLSNIVCTGGASILIGSDQPFQSGDSGATINLGSGENVICTFFNTLGDVPVGGTVELLVGRPAPSAADSGSAPGDYAVLALSAAGAAATAVVLGAWYARRRFQQKRDHL